MNGITLFNVIASAVSLIGFGILIGQLFG